MRPTKQAVYSSRTADKFVVRLPDGMRSQIEVLARERHQSMNSYMIAKLERALAVDMSEEHAPWTPVNGMTVEHTATGSIATISMVVFDKSTHQLAAMVDWLVENEGCPKSCHDVPLKDLRPYVV